VYSVGIDISKGKSTVCILSITGEVIASAFEIKHERSDLLSLDERLQKLASKEDIKVVMEATGVYHWPVFKFLKDRGYFVSIVNPLRMKVFSKNINFRRIKTDKIDSAIIATYGTEKWHSLSNDECSSDSRDDLRKLTRAYESYQKTRIILKQILDLELEKSMPGIKKIITVSDRMCDFALEFEHFDKIKKMSETKFIERFNKWAKKKNYRFFSSTSTKIYYLAKQAIPSVPYDEVSVITLSNSVKALQSLNGILNDILTQAEHIAKSLPEYKIVRNMQGVGDVLSILLISEIGDIRLLRSKKSLVSMAGIDVPPYESGQFVAKNRTITKKGNSHLRRDLYLAVCSLAITKPTIDNEVYLFIQRKKAEGKHYKQCIVAGMRKFLHIYYARVKEEFIKQGIWNIEY